MKNSKLNLLNGGVYSSLFSYKELLTKSSKIKIIERSFAKLTMLFGLIMAVSVVQAQVVNMYVHAGGKMQQFSGEKTSIWGNATNYGKWGSTEGAITLFYGITWKNDNSATMPGVGMFHFIQPRPAPYAADATQYLEGGFDWATSAGCSFPDFWLENANDLYLVNDDSKVRDTFKFVDGHVIHQGFDFTVGDNNPGEILGYNETQFFVTNGYGNDAEGFLEREGINTADAEEAFPIGIAVGDYTPARIKNTATEDDYSVRVFANTYDGGTAGTINNSETVARTWDVKERTTGGSDVSLELQHNSSSEGSSFASSNTKHYITHYVGTSPNGPGTNGVDTTSLSEWDLLKYAKLYPGETGNGYITTGTSISNAVVSKRGSLSVFSPFSKTIYGFSPVPVELMHLTAEWDGGNALVKWATASEINNSHFEIERSLDGVNFKSIGTTLSKANGGNSQQILNYSYLDMGIKPHVSSSVYYRLKQIDFDGQYEILGPRSLDIDRGNPIRLLVYPTIARQTVYASTIGYNETEKINFRITSSFGALLFSQDVLISDEGKIAISIEGIRAGSYWLTAQQGDKLATQKFIICN